MAGRKHTKRQVEARLDAVEFKMLSGSWTRKVCRELSEHWNVTPRQIERDRASIMESWRRSFEGTDRTTKRAEALAQLEAFLGACAQVAIGGAIISERVVASEGDEADDGEVEVIVTRTAPDARMAAVVADLHALRIKLLGLDEPLKVDVLLEGASSTDPRVMLADLMAALPEIADMAGLEPAQLIDVAFKPTQES